VPTQSISTTKGCPICGLELTRERRQFRADDESATLVVGCPTHGSVAQLAIRFRSAANNERSYILSSIQSSAIPEIEHNIIPNIVRLVPKDDMYAMKLKVLGSFHLEHSYYKITDIQSIINN
jgi:hypothetical protein